MALYSWFSRTSEKAKSLNGYDHLLKTSTSVKYIENYTMWPTAKIKTDVNVILPKFSKLDEEIQNHQKAKIALTTMNN